MESTIVTPMLLDRLRVLGNAADTRGNVRASLGISGRDPHAGQLTRRGLPIELLGECYRMARIQADDADADRDLRSWLLTDNR